MMMSRLKNELRKSQFLRYVVFCARGLFNSEFRQWVIDIHRHPAVVRIDQNGELFPSDLIYHSHLSWDAGFWATWCFSLRHIALAQKLKAKVVVEWINPSYSRVDADGKLLNCFEDFFIQPDGIDVADAAKGRFVVRSRKRDGSVLLGSDILYTRSDETVSDYADIHKRYFTLKDDMEQRLRRDMSLLEWKGTVLGVHIRGTDYKKTFLNHPEFVPFEDYVDAAIKTMQQIGAETVFLATDDTDALELFQKAFPGKLSYYNDTHRANGDVAVNFVFNTDDDIGNQRTQLAYEVLRDVYTLSAADALIAGISNVSFAARVINCASEKGYKKCEILSKGIHTTGRTFQDKTRHI